MSTYIDAINAFNNVYGTKAGIFKPAGTSDASVENVRYEALKKVVSEDMFAQFIDEDFLASYEGMYGCKLDIILVPELEKVPEHSIQNLKRYLKGGGAMIVSSDDFFMTSQERGFIPQFEVAKQKEDEYFRKTTAFLGIKPYKAAIKPEKAIVDADMIDGMPSVIDMDLPYEGICCNTGSDVLVSEPPYGHVFPERY